MKRKKENFSLLDGCYCCVLDIMLCTNSQRLVCVDVCVCVCWRVNVVYLESLCVE